MPYNTYGEEFVLNLKSCGLQSDLYNRFDEYGIPPTPPAVGNIIQEDGFNILQEDGFLILEE
jgi:hypothetical protein